MSQADDQQADVVIISAFGRGNWLATELVNRGWKTTLIDVSERLGSWSPADIEGPFGLFETSDLLPSQVSRLMDEGEMVNVERGFALWLPEGPLELRSEMTGYQLGRKGVPREVEEYLRAAATPERDLDRSSGVRSWHLAQIFSRFNSQSHPAIRAANKSSYNPAFDSAHSAKRAKPLLKQSFEANWLLHFSHQFSSVVYRESHNAAEYGTVRPLFAPFKIRLPTEAGFQKGLRKCQAAGVRVRARARIRDLRSEGRFVDAVEVEDDRSGVEKGRSFVWFLSSAETQRLDARVFDTLFPGGAIQSTWHWSRYRVQLKGKVFADQLPVWLAMVSDLFLPWTQDNLLILKKCMTKADLFTGVESGSANGGSNGGSNGEAHPCLDVWVRVPTRDRWNQEACLKIGRAIEQLLADKLPKSGPKILELPPEARFSAEKLGPARWPVFEESEMAGLGHFRANNLFFDGPERWEALDWLAAFRCQADILARLERMKTQWDAATLREAARSPSR
jgi:hypothetical protein